jgi:hypothetical protein
VLVIRAVAAGDPQELALLDVKADVVECPKLVIARLAERCSACPFKVCTRSWARRNPYPAV